MKKIFLFLFIIGLSFFLYYAFNKSYRIALEAKIYYELKDYSKAEELAQESYKLDKYNRLAFTILTQSKIAKIWKIYIKESNEYLMEINSIANKDIITNADKIKIKMMLEIIIGEYKNLPKSKLLNEELKEKAKNNYIKAVKLYNGIFKRRT